MSIINAIIAKENLVSLKGTSEEKIKQAEMELGIHFTKEYKEYVAYFGAVSYKEHELTGVCDVEAINVVGITLMHRNLMTVPKDWYVIEEAHIDDIVFWQTEEGTIYRTQPNTKPVEVCKSLEEYIKTNL